MASSFISGLGGLRSHQGWLDVIGNNLANANTTGYKSSRALFSDLFSRTLRPATSATSQLGGTNPSQIGLGVQLGAVDRFFGQGALNATGRVFDLALSGNGFFALSGGQSTGTRYSRAGSFGLDAGGNLVDLASGFRVLSAQGQGVTIDTDSVLPPQATSQMVFAGNLPAKVTGPLAEELGSVSSFVEGTPATLTGTAVGALPIPDGVTWTMELAIDGSAPQTVSITGGATPTTMADVAAAIDQLDGVAASVLPGGQIELVSDRNGTASKLKISPGDPGEDLASALGLSLNLVTGAQSAASGATSLNMLTTNLGTYANGDTIDVSGTDAAGAPVQASFQYGTDGTTVADLVAFVDAQFAGATASFDAATGKLLLTADAAGEAELSLLLTDPAGQTGGTDWAQHAMATTVNGTGPDTVSTAVEVWDASGQARLTTFEYQRAEDGSWTLQAAVDASEGTVLSGPVTGITFAPDGTLLTPPSATITVQFTGQPAQNLTLDLGAVGGIEGLTQFGSPASVTVASQNGYGAGELASMSVDTDGTINGYYTNGEQAVLANIGVARFANASGLRDAGDNLWAETANSGQVVLGAGNSGGSGAVIGGALELSNVDTAEEFVNLIQAQRGYQANARVISTQDQMLEEIVNIV